ncbi:MAG: hypothetical protein AAGI89_14980 [Pseudomonadota bacterium]
MIRILLPLALAAVALLGPWMADGNGNAMNGFDLAPTTVNCALDFDFSVEACKPQGDLLNELVGYTMLFGAGSAVLSLVGLLPLIGRLTSMTVVAAGLTGVGAFGVLVLGMMQGAGLDLAVIGLGAYGTLILGLLTVFAGLNGIRGEGSDY